MGGRVKCLVRCLRRKKLPSFLKPLLLKIVGDVVRSRPLPHSLVVVVKYRRSLAPRPRQIIFKNPIILVMHGTIIHQSDHRHSPGIFTLSVMVAVVLIIYRKFLLHFMGQPVP